MYRDFKVFSVFFLLIILASASAHAQHSAYPPSFPRPSNHMEEYRGYTGQTVQQAYFKCVFEALKLSSDKRSQRYQEVMEACMMAEGFFKEGKRSFKPEEMYQYMPPVTETRGYR
jgi:hypothetical protein